MTSTTTTTASNVLESSIPEGITISEYRRSRPRKASRWQRVRKVVAR